MSSAVCNRHTERQEELQKAIKVEVLRIHPTLTIPKCHIRPVKTVYLNVVFVLANLQLAGYLTISQALVVVIYLHWTKDLWAAGLLSDEIHTELKWWSPVKFKTSRRALCIIRKWLLETGVPQIEGTFLQTWTLSKIFCCVEACYSCILEPQWPKNHLSRSMGWTFSVRNCCNCNWCSRAFDKLLRPCIFCWGIPITIVFCR